ncbi:YdbL family protein [Thiohalobacter sp. IOR34]|nr:YdbL family protein [Thiohalobacter sp. IOR34]WJW76801.1 YdbL family protein [Thiohalobacter sp. IOR34]
MKTTRHSFFPALLALLLLAGCVTINVYFPAAAAQEAADRIIDQVYGSEGQPAPATPPADDKAVSPQSRQASPLLIGVLEWVVPPAVAAPNFDIQTPAIQAITAGMEARHARLAPYYQSGAVGMTGDGLIRVRDLGAVPLRERRQLQQLVSDENRDRQALYREIARANGHPEWEAEIRATFARRWIERAPSGWWYQDAGGNWKRK